MEYIGCIPVFDIEMDSPYHNFVANGVVVHNCNYSKDKFGCDLTYILPFYLKHGYDVYNRITEAMANDVEYKSSVLYSEADTVFDYIYYKNSNRAIDNCQEWWDDLCKFCNYRSTIDEVSKSYLTTVTAPGYFTDMEGVIPESTPEEARFLLPLGLATKIVVTANYREWRHIFKLRCEKHAHPEMRRIMCALWLVLNTQIPVIFDDIRDMVNEYLDDDQGLMNGLVATDCVNIGLRYFKKPTIKE